MKQKLRLLPNLITMGNLFCGFLAILFATRVHEGGSTSHDYYVLAIIMLLVAGLLDFFDGFIARLLGVSSEIGRELDSLADVVSFGIAPALLIYQRALTDTHWVGVIAAGFYVSCSAWRLARFNVMSTNSGRKTYFTGMPIEGGAVLLMSVVLSSERPFPADSTIMIGVALASVIIAGLLMVSKLRFTADVPWSIRLGALAVMLAAFIRPGQWIFLIPLTYVAYGIVCNLLALKKKATPPQRYEVPSFDMDLEAPVLPEDIETTALPVALRD